MLLKSLLISSYLHEVVFPGNSLPKDVQFCLSPVAFHHIKTCLSVETALCYADGFSGL